MENEVKIVKVYSNNSKKARLKRNKNKFQRVWDAEKQTYVKVRKAKYPVRTQTKRKDWTPAMIDEKIKSIKAQKKKPKKSVPVTAKQKPETVVHAKAIVREMPVRKFAPYGVELVWDQDILRYKKAA